ncbi:MAG: TetR/AcrR family transcriptional regulator [Bryobacterales bacterium]|nr:TetR/AcrR family transcriptional regulator [Bryobacterales bacterium]
MAKPAHALERAPGRPRNQETEQRILDTALRMLAEEGYSRMSLDAVAVAAGVSKPTIYRRWASKADLATAAVRTLQLAEPPVDTGSTPGDLIGVLENFCRSLMRPNGMSLIGTVLAEEAHTPELLALFRDRLVTPRRAMLRVILERARDRGELRPAADIDCAVSALVGAFYGRYLASSRIPHNFSRNLVEMVWHGIAVKRGKSSKLR